MWKIIVGLLVVAALVFLATLKRPAEPEPDFAEVSRLEVDGNAEILRASADAQLIVHTNAKRNTVDVIDISVPEAPARLARVYVPGEPTSLDLSPDGQPDTHYTAHDRLGCGDGDSEKGGQGDKKSGAEKGHHPQVPQALEGPSPVDEGVPAILAR